MQDKTHNFMKKPNWEKFFEDKIRKIFSEKKSVIDIGGGLRALKAHSNRYDERRAWIAPLIEKVDYKILDPVPDYEPHIVGDIHDLPLGDHSQDAIICIAVLEHVENPFVAVQEIHRVLKKGGCVFIYVPFLYYYHAEIGYYNDYWRFSEDALRVLLKDFKEVEIVPVRGAIETWFRIGPLGRYRIVQYTARVLDRLLGKNKSKQVSGFNVFAVK
jgi:SAM-dependent methyltransferase